MKKELYVSEIFSSIQGEGVNVGRPATFLRVAGCNLSCQWCDTKYAWKENSSMDINCILEKLVKEGLNKNGLLVVTGGEPLLEQHQPELSSLLSNINSEIHVETNGSFLPNALLTDNVNEYIISLKLSSAYVSDKTYDPIFLSKLWDDFAYSVGSSIKFSLKLVIGSDTDIIQAIRIFNGIKTIKDWVIQPESSYMNIDFILNRFSYYYGGKLNDFRFIPQVHKLLDLR